MDFYDNRFASQLSAAIKKRREDWASAIVAGSATSLDDYRERVGYVRALDDIHRVMEEIARKLSQPESDMDPRKATNLRAKA